MLFDKREDVLCVAYVQSSFGNENASRCDFKA